METATGLTPSAAAWRLISRSMARRARGFNLVLVRAPDALHGRASDPLTRGHQAEPMQVTAEAERGSVAQAAAGREFGPVECLAFEVTAKPRLALGEERPDVSLRIRPTSPAGRRDGHHHAAIRMDDHAQAP